jgi:hypothetical protein
MKPAAPVITIIVSEFVAKVKKNGHRMVPVMTFYYEKV